MLVVDWHTHPTLNFVAEALPIICRLRSSHKAQASALEKSRSMQDDMADILLSLKVCCVHNKGQLLNHYLPASDRCLPMMLTVTCCSTARV